MGLVSHVPGGLGVFETTIILLLPPEAKGTGVIGALLVYRAVYYLIPLILASVSITGFELYTRRKAVGMVARRIGGVISFILPHFLAATTFLGGVILIFSGATPTIHGRLTWLNQFMPLTVIELSHFLSSLAGAALLILASGIQKRLDSAYLLSLTLLVLGAIWSLLKGFDYEEALILMVFVLLLLSSRKQFFRKASLTSERFSLGWIMLVCAVLVCAGWIGLFSYKHVEYSNDLWWRWTLFGDASRFIRAGVGVASVISLFGPVQVTQAYSCLPIPADIRGTGASRQNNQTKSKLERFPGIVGRQVPAFQRDEEFFPDVRGVQEELGGDGRSGRPEIRSA